jgi:hypothetical protein
MKLFLILVLHLRQFFIVRIFVKRVFELSEVGIMYQWCYLLTVQSSVNSCYSISTIVWKIVIQVASCHFLSLFKKIPQSRTKVIKFLKSHNVVPFQRVLRFPKNKMIWNPCRFIVLILCQDKAFISKKTNHVTIPIIRQVIY